MFQGAGGITPVGLPSLTCVDLMQGLGEGNRLSIPCAESGCFCGPALHLNNIRVEGRHGHGTIAKLPVGSGTSSK